LSKGFLFSELKIADYAYINCNELNLKYIYVITVASKEAKIQDRPPPFCRETQTSLTNAVVMRNAVVVLTV